MVGLGRFELPTSRLSSARSNQLSYRPDKPLLIYKDLSKKSREILMRKGYVDGVSNDVRKNGRALSRGA